MGQDLAYTQGRSHAKGANHAVNVSESQEFLPVPGIFNTLSIPKNLKVFLNHYEDLIAECQTPVWNCTEGGAEIRGTTRKTLREALLTLTFPKETVTENLSTLLHTKTERTLSSKMKTVFLTHHARFLDLRILSKELIKDIERIIPRLDNPKASEPSLSELLGHYQIHSQKLSPFKETLHLLRDNMVEAYVEKSKHLKKKIHEIDWNKDTVAAKEVLRSNRFYFEHLDNACAVLCEQMQKSEFMQENILENK